MNFVARKILSNIHLSLKNLISNLQIHLDKLGTNLLDNHFAIILYIVLRRKIRQ